jgi:alpha-glucosidase (family GH31 glycosyl hydrolase)
MGWASASHRDINSQIQTANAAIPQFQEGINNADNCLSQGQTLTAQIYPLTLNSATKRLAQQLLQQIQRANKQVVDVKTFFTASKLETQIDQQRLLTLATELNKGRSMRTNQQSGSQIMRSASSIAWNIRQRIEDQSGPMINGVSTAEALESAQNTYNQVANNLRRYAS